jgi:hypothetical protein
MAKEEVSRKAKLFATRADLRSLALLGALAEHLPQLDTR